MQTVKVMNLGDILTPDFNTIVDAFATLLQQKKSQSDKNQMKMAISNILGANKSLLDDFNLGKVEKQAFIAQMVDLIKTATAVELSQQEFLNTWNKGNIGDFILTNQQDPNAEKKYDIFKANLQAAIAYNNQKDQEIIFLSNTNPIDIEHFIAILKDNSEFNCEYTNNVLSNINGIKIFLTYIENKSKDSLLEDIVRDSRKSYTPNFNFGKNTPQPFDITYVIANQNDIEDPTLAERVKATHGSMIKMANNCKIRLECWPKDQQPDLDTFLKNPMQVSEQFRSKF